MINERQAHKYCKDNISKIENYDKAIHDTTKTWHLHHRTEIWWNCSASDLIDNECYYNRKACELIFLTPYEHARLHNQGENNPMYGKRLSDESRKKLSEAHKGENNHMYGKTRSKESRKKISEALKAAWVKRRKGNIT